MARVLILQNLSFDGPGYLGQWLQRQGLAADVRNAELGHQFPASLDGYDALALLGGSMSANDELPHLRLAEELFRQAVQRAVPTVGHCLGGQLMSRALGAAVHASPAPEVGFHEVEFLPPASGWFGDARRAQLMQWHYEAFDLPQGALPLAQSAACPLQAWAMGPHLAMQFHIEVDAAKVYEWCDDAGPDHAAGLASWPSMHGIERIREELPRLLPAHQAMAAGVYRHWLAQIGG